MNKQEWIVDRLKSDEESMHFGMDCTAPTPIPIVATRLKERGAKRRRGKLAPKKAKVSAR